MTPLNVEVGVNVIVRASSPTTADPAAGSTPSTEVTARTSPLASESLATTSTSTGVAVSVEASSSTATGAASATSIVIVAVATSSPSVTVYSNVSRPVKDGSGV